MIFNGYMMVEWLQAHKACQGQIANFRRTFGADKVAITQENLKLGENAGLNYNWLARMLGVKDFCHQAQDRHNKGSVHLWAVMIKLGEVKE